MKKLGHIMLDLETMSNGSNSAIVSIGAVEFDINTGELGKEFYERVDLQSCLDLGLKVKASTIYWWLQQNEHARLEVSKGGIHISNALVKLNTFFLKIDDLNNYAIWGNSARFDIQILADAYYACKLQIPWNFRYERDVRTLVSFAPQIKEHFPFIGIEHNPIDDCKHQIGYCTAIWQKINLNM